MDIPMSLPALDIPGLLRQHGLRPKRSLGQNYLVDERHLQKVVQVAGVTTRDTVLEIGAGLGNLTRYLAHQAQSVVAVEIDQRLIPILKQVTAPFSNVTTIPEDILALQPEDMQLKNGYIVVANIPYYITSVLIRHLLEARVQPQRLVLTVQVEVAERICAEPGRMSLLALSVQVYSRPNLVARIPSSAFYPSPKVDSAIVRADLYPRPLIPESLLPTFFALVKAGFSQKRKTLRNAIAAGMQLSPSETESLLKEAGIDPRRRAETLSMEEWRNLAELFSQPREQLS